MWSIGKVLLVVKIIFLNWNDFQTSKLKDLFKSTKPENILNFLKKWEPFPKSLTKYNHTLNKKTHIKDKSNLTLPGIKWRIDVDILLNKIQTR